MNAAADAESLLEAARAEKVQQPRSALLSSLTTGELRDILAGDYPVSMRQRAVFEFERRCIEIGSTASARLMNGTLEAINRLVRA